jgi:DNA-binding CsgD family transcriptional regulator
MSEKSNRFHSRSIYVQILILVLAFTLLVCISSWFMGDIMNKHMTDSITAVFSNTEINITAEMVLQEYFKEMRRMRLIFIAVGLVLATLFIGLLLRLSSVRKELQDQDIKEKHGLTSREQEIFAMLLDGTAPKEISHSLKISRRTVDSHIANLYRKLGIQSRAELFAKYKTK